eukprot:GFUD01019453.1.p1 GENE.GFUD01019453.1~~GFUD01019453.1.p1  ORF type:complete len:411 (-),score=118.70 GFUD01019453.1:792-2024(-)
MSHPTAPHTMTNDGSSHPIPNNKAKPPELELNLRPGVHMSPPRATARSPPGLSSHSPGNSMVGSPPTRGMDDLADCFAGSFTVTNAPNDINRPHPRFAQYKMKSSGSNQEHRRKRLLDHQKGKRDDLVNHARALAMGDFDEEKDEEEEEEEMDTSGEIRQRKLRKTYKNQLMLSEWLVEVPEDLEKNWLLLLCPEGRRNFVVAANGSTKVFSKSGKQVKSFPSNLPGGNRNQGRARNKYTILDCIYSESNGIFYILDMMCWDGYQYYDCDTEFRLSWVQQKFIENQDLRVRSRINPYSFQPLPVYQCKKESIADALNSPMPFNDHLDGLLIYHKEVHYMPGKTPLVGWIKGYMVPELLDIQVCEDLMDQRPADYGGMKTYLKKTYDRVERLKKADEDRLRADLEMMEGGH